ncbi:MAG: hypothetical protein HQ500_07880 [Flavobacteriales bacterium]|nr:hypothetical protein [Flavobacteriales bacterium]
MMMEEKGRSKRIEEMIADLKSKNNRRVIGALKMVPHEGSPEMIEPMFALFSEIQTKDVRILLEKTLNNLKDSNCILPMVNILRDSKRPEVHKEVLNSIWQSGLDVAEELPILIDIAASGDFMTTVEVVTVIENLEFDNDTLLTDAIVRMDEMVQKQGEKQELLVSLRQLLLDKLLGEQ